MEPQKKVCCSNPFQNGVEGKKYFADQKLGCRTDGRCPFWRFFTKRELIKGLLFLILAVSLSLSLSLSLLLWNFQYRGSSQEFNKRN